MKILYICTFYHGAMIFRDAMDQLVKKGHSVKAYNAVAKGTKVASNYHKIMDEMVTHRECFHKWDRFFFHKKQYKIYNDLRMQIPVKDYDVIHAHTLLNGGYVAYLLNRTYGTPYVVTVRSTDLNVFLKYAFFRKIAEKIVRNSAGILFLSKGYQERFINNYVKASERTQVRKKSRVIPNGLESFWLEHQIKQDKKQDEKTIRLICVGVIKKEKNMMTILQVMDDLISKGYATELVVVGSANDLEIYDALQKKEHVQVYDFMKKEELIEKYNQSDIFILPSVNETFGRVYAEALTQGLPVIYTSGQGFDKIFDEGVVGYSTPHQDVERMSDVILKIREQYSEISKRCVQKSALFDWKRITGELEEMYQKCNEKGISK